MNPDTLITAKQRLRIPELWRMLSLSGEPAKSCRSPLRGDDTNPSFSVFNDGLLWKDHGTGEHGDAIDFLARARGLSVADAIREFKKLAGVDDPPPPAIPHSALRIPHSFDWQTCVAALTPEHRTKLADWRGYSPKFVEWLHAQNLVGLFEGERIAFPVHDAEGCVIASHYRRKEDESWRYFPKLEDIGAKTSPLIIGAIASAKTVFAFESQWDLCALLDAFHWHIQPLESTALIATRGASNGRLLVGLIRSGSTGDPPEVFAFAQNDPAGEKWLAAVAAACGCKCLHVVTPAPHKDLNVWTKAGATTNDIRKAIADASPVTVAPAPDLHAAPPSRNVSKPTFTLPESEAEEDAPPAPFPLDALPPAMALLAAGISRTARVPDRLTGPCVLGIVSAAIGAGLEVQSDIQRTTRGNLFLLVSAETGTGKSRTFELIAAPLLDHQERLQERWRTQSAPRLQAQIKILDREIAGLEKKAAKEMDTRERERLRGELEFKIAERDELGRKNVQPVILAQDATTERLTAMVEEQSEVLFSASSDCRKVVDNLLGRYSANKSTDESFYLAGYSGDHVRVDRGSRPPVNLRRPCLGLLWFGQPDLLESMLAADSLSASGFLPRLLLCHSHAAPQRIEGEPEVIPEAVLNCWTALIENLLAAYRFPPSEFPVAHATMHGAVEAEL